jgi:hypothetical protein
VGNIGDFIPNNGGKIVESDISAMLLNRSMKWNNRVAAFIFGSSAKLVGKNL